MENKAQKSHRSIVRNKLVPFFKNGIVETADLLGLLLETKYKGFQILKKGELRRIVRDLVELGEIHKIGKDKFQISNLGTIRALPAIQKILAKDGQVRILVFDIPETERGKRDGFRRHIKKLGFKQHQQSVWVSKYDCENWILKVIDYHKVGDYTSLYIGKHIW